MIQDFIGRDYQTCHFFVALLLCCTNKTWNELGTLNFHATKASLLQRRSKRDRGERKDGIGLFSKCNFFLKFDCLLTYI